MSVKLLAEHHLEVLSLKGGCTGSSESTLVKMPHSWKSVAENIETLNITANQGFNVFLIVPENICHKKFLQRVYSQHIFSFGNKNSNAPHSITITSAVYVSITLFKIYSVSASLTHRILPFLLLYCIYHPYLGTYIPHHYSSYSTAWAEVYTLVYSTAIECN